MAQLARTIIQVFTLIINIIVLIIYKHGDDGHFLGASFNKNRDAETLASGVYVGYLIYNIVVIFCAYYDELSLSSSTIDPLMNFIGFIIWLLTGASMIHFWYRFIPDNHFITQNPDSRGIAMGAMTLVNALLYLANTLVTCINYRRSRIS